MRETSGTERLGRREDEIFSALVALEGRRERREIGEDEFISAELDLVDELGRIQAIQEIKGRRTLFS